MPLPRLRPVEAVPVEAEEGEVVIALRDPEGIAEEALILTPAAFFVASLLDGRNDTPQIRSAFAGQFGGAMISGAEIEAVVNQLDAAAYLDTPTFRLRRAEARRKFAELPARPAVLAGASYPADPAALGEALRGFFTAEGGPGAGLLIVPGAERPAPRGLVAPHIDFGRGGPVYAHAHATLRDGVPPLVLVLGVAHAGGETPYLMTRKSYETPCGAVETDLEAADALAAGCGEWLTEDEYAHRLEHSIEFQAVWLRTLHPASPFRMVPVLCAGLGTGPEGAGSPAADPRAAAFIAAARRLVAGRRALVLASVDLSHVGPKFGDPVEVDEALADAVQDGDEPLLAAAAAGDPEAFWAAGMADGNARRVDALGAVYTMLAVLAPATGRVLGYGQGEDPAGGLVSFAAMAFE